MANISICALSFCKSEILRQKALEAFNGHTVTFHNAKDTAQSDALVSLLKTADAAIIGRELINAELLTKCPRLKFIALYGVGHDNINLKDLKDHEVTFYFKPGVNSLFAAELTIGLTLALLRNITRTNSMLKKNQWHKDGGTSLAGKKIAIVGAGHVGSKVAKFFKLLGADLLICDILNKSALCREVDASQLSLDEAVKIADIISIHVPLTDLTRNMLKDHHLQNKQLKFLINTSRSEVIDENLLINALKSGILEGAALDVWYNEPHINPMLSQLDNVVGTPHIGGNSKESVIAMGTAAIEGITAYFEKNKN